MIRLLCASVLLLGCWVVGQASLSAAETTADKPNIVFILYDDMGYAEPPSYWSQSEFKLPNFDRLTREGMRFTDAHTASSICTPARYGLLTGHHPMRIGQFDVLHTYSSPIIDKDRLTVGALLKQHGYHTACVGKWHLGLDWELPEDMRKSMPPIGAIAANGPITRGFDYFCGVTHTGTRRDRYAAFGMMIEQDKVVANLDLAEVQSHLARKAIAYINDRARQGGPFFLYLPLLTPHIPFVPAREFHGKSGAGMYGDWLFQGDWITGQILDALERHKLADDTLVIVTSDNGAAFRLYAPLRDWKKSIYEGGHRVPFVARWPGKIKAGAVCSDLISLNDFLPTCAELLGAKLPANAAEDGFSILPHLLGTAKRPVREDAIHQSHFGDLAIRHGPWKLIYQIDGRKELYNLADDLSETHDLVESRPGVVDRMHTLMQSYIANGRSTPGEPQKNPDAESMLRPTYLHFRN